MHMEVPEGMEGDATANARPTAPVQPVEQPAPAVRAENGGVRPVREQKPRMAQRNTKWQPKRGPGPNQPSSVNQQPGPEPNPARRVERPPKRAWKPRTGPNPTTAAFADLTAQEAASRDVLNDVLVENRLERDYAQAKLEKVAQELSDSEKKKKTLELEAEKLRTEKKRMDEAASLAIRGRIKNFKYRWHENPWFAKRGLIPLKWWYYSSPIFVFLVGITIAAVVHFEVHQALLNYDGVQLRWPPIVLFLFSFWALTLLIILLWNRKYIWYEYEFGDFVDLPHPDERPDSLSLGELKHPAPIYAKVFFSTNDPKYNIEYKVRGCVISLELLSQLLVPQAISLTSTPQIIMERLEYLAKSIHSVNTTRWRNVAGEAVIQDTILVAMGYTLQTLERRRVELEVFRMAPAV